MVQPPLPRPESSKDDSASALNWKMFLFLLLLQCIINFRVNSLGEGNNQTQGWKPKAWWPCALPKYSLSLWRLCFSGSYLPSSVPASPPVIRSWSPPVNLTVLTLSPWERADLSGLSRGWWFLHRKLPPGLNKVACFSHDWAFNGWWGLTAAKFQSWTSLKLPFPRSPFLKCKGWIGIP